MATTKMKKYKMGGPGDEVTGSEQGKGANLARKLGTIIPSIGAAAVAIKAGMDKRKENREKKKIAKAEVSKNPVKVTKKDLPKYPKPNRIGFSGGITSKAKYGTSVGATKTVFKPVGKSTEPKPKGYNNNLVPLNPSGPPTKKIKKYATGGMHMMPNGTMMKNSMMKTGGMVNSNSKITAAKAATGSVGGISKAISKGAVKSTSPKGKVGGTSTAPKCASPKKTK